MLLLDTCTLLWLVAEPDRLSDKASGLIRRHAGALHISSITAFELGIKQRKGRLTLPLPAPEWFSRALALHGLRDVPIDGEIAGRSTQLPPIHGDPADRFIVATAQRDSLLILTPDPHIHAYPDTRVVW